MMLHATGIGVPDSPPEIFTYGHHDHARLARTFEPFIAAGFSDDEAWEALFSEEERLTTFRVVYGNRKGKRR